MEYLGLLVEVIFLIMGIYLYLYVRGFLKAKTPEEQIKMDEFRKKNGWWLRILALALIAIMSINIGLHIKDLLAA